MKFVWEEQDVNPGTRLNVNGHTGCIVADQAAGTTLIVWDNTFNISAPYPTRGYMVSFLNNANAVPLYIHSASDTGATQ